jgi:hypothetical protein
MTFLVVQAFIAVETTPAVSEPHRSMVASIAGKAPTILPSNITTNNHKYPSPDFMIFQLFSKTSS